ncbi:TonB-dependent receptor plug domain-containing protein [Phenylobacterium sp.]|uniref:TonB-dependent receptor plug domain-containing protein n=1 Tax=Phenylobacterium sp. TaxID=1871053 RepID=UPI0035B105B4
MQLIAGVSLAALTTMAAQAAQAAEAAAGADSEAVEEVIVTGTRQTGLKAADSPAPIQVVDATSLQASGQTDLRQGLSNIVPSFTAQAFGGDMANMTLSAKLRGLSPNHALVLINGKRRHGTANLAVLGGPYQGGASADLNFIPLESVDHIEVLLEGAAAQYGTDAIAGVVNIIQKKGDSGGEIVASGGRYIDGGGLTGDLSANLGVAPFENAFLNLTVETKYHDYSFRGDVDPRLLDTPYNTTSSSRLSAYPAVASAPGYPYLNRIPGDAEYRLTTGSYNFGYDVTPDLEIYSFGTYGHKFGQAYENYRTANLIVGKNGVWARPLGFSPREAIREDDYAVTGGVDGKAGEWRFDLSTTYGSDSDSIYTLDSVNRSLYVDTSTTTSDGYSPSDFHDGDFINTQWTTTLDLSREFDVGLAGPLTFAAGVEYRKETYEIKAGDAASRYKEGGQSFPGFSLTDAGKHDRNNKAVYLDLAVKPVDALQLDGAVRYESFSDFGDTTVAKLTGRYDFSPAFAVRATASTGFRAPTLAEEYYSATNVSPTSAFVQLPPNSAGAKLVGVDGLKPEKSTNYSVGFVAHPISRLTTTLDVYQIEISDRIVGSGALYGSGGGLNSPAVVDAILANGNVLDSTVSITGINIFTNGLDTRTKGADFVATYSSDFGDFGHVDWTVTANYTSTKVTHIAPPPSQLAAGVSLFDKTAISILEDATPKYRVTAGAVWSLGRFTVNLKESLYGESSEWNSRNGSTYYQTKIKPTAITDLDVSVKLLDSVKVAIGATNLFNKYPNKINADLRNDYFTHNSNSYVTQYPTFSPFGINGGYYYGRLTWTF